MKQVIYFLALCFLCTAPLAVRSQDYVDDTKAVMGYLREKQQTLRDNLKAGSGNAYEILSAMLDVGLWEDVTRYMQRAEKLSAVEKAAIEAQYCWYNNDFKRAGQVITGLSRQDQEHPYAVRIRANLLVEAWLLPEAEKMASQAIATYPDDEKLKQVLGRALLLQKKYTGALALARSIRAANPSSAYSYLLEADVYFWDQQPQLAEEPLKKGLALNPLDADARFSYGYAIWRRFDARLLDQMAAQWEVALAINPLHFQTHWHWGNGHTNLTFADYADEHETAIRDRLKTADDYVRQNRIADAVELTVKVGKEYSKSVLPGMHQASILYSDFDHPERHKRLNEAEVILINILKTKKHYGPAHNALAAVIKSKRIPYLSTYDSIRNQLLTNKITDWENFSTVFPDVTYYPGEISKGMAWNQLYTSIVYFPFLTKQGNSFVIPPLHIDLAIAMKSPHFRFTTTFDNRQWMDIRGVGSGAADIGYMERGAFGERNVLLHEYVHLFHGRVLTDKQNRQIRQRYFNAMEKGLTLDYYSQNNESEYLAQTYPAYFEYIKVHPLDFKSMNTHGDLVSKDPEMYAFLHGMISNEKAYLAGDKSAMASNWAQVYLNLSNRMLRGDFALAGRYLDTALQYDRHYLPALTAYARYELVSGNTAKAKQYIIQLEGLDKNYAPIYLVKAEILAKESGNETFDEQARLYEKAFEIEDDLQFKAQNAIQLRSFYHQNGRIADAVKVAGRYAAIGSTVSTYLRDRRDDALAYTWTMRAQLGDDTHMDELTEMVAKRPQNYNLRGMYADALLANGKYSETVATMKQVQRILSASSNRRSDFDLRIAEAYYLMGQPDSVSTYLHNLTGERIDVGRLTALDNHRLVRLLLRTDKIQQAGSLLAQIVDQTDTHYQASKLLSKALLSEKEGNTALAGAEAREALRIHPYLLETYQILERLCSHDPAELDKLHAEYKKVKATL